MDDTPSKLEADIRALAASTRTPDEIRYRDALDEIADRYAAMQAPILANAMRDDDGIIYSPQNLADWLDKKYQRHGEIEDKYAADLIRHYLAMQAPIVTDYVMRRCIVDYAVLVGELSKGLR